MATAIDEVNRSGERPRNHSLCVQHVHNKLRPLNWRIALWPLMLLCTTLALADDIRPGDDHYTPAGFFDVHVCHWPDRPLFFMFILSSYRFDEIDSVHVHDPNGDPLAEIPLKKYRIIQQKGAPEKRAFIRQLDIPVNAPDGWYTATITLKDGTVYTARDYVVLHHLPLAKDFEPAPDATNVPTDTVLSWSPVPGAKYYQVFIRDMWDDGRLIVQSELLTEPHLQLKKGLLRPNGEYVWRVHARDTNGHALFGDFNHGSLTGEMAFSTGSK